MGVNLLYICSLPERIRPTVLAFGGVADGFVPFDAHTSSNNVSSSKQDGDKSQAELELASIVMKAVQVCLHLELSRSKLSNAVQLQSLHVALLSSAGRLTTGLYTSPRKLVCA